MKLKRAISALIFSLVLHLLVLFVVFELVKPLKLKTPPPPKETFVDIVTLPQKEKPKIKVKEHHKVASNISKKGFAKLYSKKEELPFGVPKATVSAKPTVVKKPAITKANIPTSKNVLKKQKTTKLSKKGARKRKHRLEYASKKKSGRLVKLKSPLFKENFGGFLSGNSKNYRYKHTREATISIGTQSIKYASYMEHIKNKIENVWVYPSFAAQTGQQGSLLVLFSIGRNGNLLRVKLIRSSGYPLLDKAAIEAVKDAAPYPPLPERFNIDVLNIYANFVYKINGFYYISK